MLGKVHHDQSADVDLDASLVGTVFDTRQELRAFVAELDASDLREELGRAEAEFACTVSGETYRGFPYGFGGMKWRECGRIYALVRKRQPEAVVETGVCNGSSTAVILLALERNGTGALSSIDLPEYTDTAYPEGSFWEAKRGSAVPKGREPGWVIPERLRGRWELTIGSSEEMLPELLERRGTIDFFLHDSEHSFECMSFEYRTAFPHIRPGGILASDDVRWNTAFQDFAATHSRELRWLGRNLAFVEA